ncbi:Unknown protein [Striga hermonthica]|uniref:CCHC-type domain-containing protein n=1 Tax=Striga hermonthica TaxID=68872 RepID=A0A9N7P4D0_STRHE|nr:Unknown protein [Striga hermonthica]
MEDNSTNAGNEFTIQAMQQHFARLGGVLEGIIERLERLEQQDHRRHDNNQFYQPDSDEEEFREPPHRGNRGGKRRRDNEVDRDLGSIKLNIPTFKGRSDPEAYLEWEKKTNLIFECHNYFEEKKVKLDAIEFTDYAIVWWDQLTTNRRRYGERPISTWAEMKSIMRKRFVPSHYWKVERQLRTKGSSQRSFSSNLYPSSKAKEGSPKINFGAASKTQNETSNTKGHMVDKGKAVASSSRSRDIKCFRCQGFGHIASECINKRVMILRENGVIESESEHESSDDEQAEETTPEHGELLVVRRALNMQIKVEEAEQQRENIFHTRCLVLGKVCVLIVDGGSCANVASCEMVEKLNLPTTKHSNPYKLQWLNDCGEIRVTKQVLVSFSIDNYKDEVLCDVVPMHASHILLGRPWQFDRRVTYDGFLNRYSLKHENRSIQLVSLNPQQVREDQFKMSQSKKLRESEKKKEKNEGKNLREKKIGGKNQEEMSEIEGKELSVEKKAGFLCKSQ